MANKKLAPPDIYLDPKSCPLCNEKASSLQAHVQSVHTDQEIQNAVLNEKANGVPDIEIGQKYGVTFRYIERLITKRQGINISQLDLRPWEQIFYGEFDGRRKKRVLVKIIGE